MLNTPNSILGLHMFGNGFQDYTLHHLPRDILHHLPRDQDEADQTIVPWILLLALLEGGSNISFFPALGNLSHVP